MFLFKRKTQEAMMSSGKHPLNSKVEVDETLIGGPESENVVGIREKRS